MTSSRRTKLCYEPAFPALTGGLRYGVASRLTSVTVVIKAVTKDLQGDEPLVSVGGYNVEVKPYGRARGNCAKSELHILLVAQDRDYVKGGDAAGGGPDARRGDES